MLEVAIAGQGDMAMLAAFLADNFADEPSLMAIFGTSGAVAAKPLRGWFKAVLSLWSSLAPGQIVVAKDGGAIVGALLASGRETLTPCAGLGWFLTVLRHCGARVVLRSWIAEWRRRSIWPVPEPVVVEFVAVRWEWRGKGVAARMFEFVHATQSVVCLETTREANVPVFRHLGYEVTGTHSTLGCPHIVMTFDARGRPARRSLPRDRVREGVRAADLPGGHALVA